MAIITLSNGGALFEERYAFPNPELVVRSVFRKQDIKYLKAHNASETASIVYFYGDRNYDQNLAAYVGETQVSPVQRFSNTHSKKNWFKNLKYPVVSMAESTINPWDMETRRSIEALCAYKMKQLGFEMVNAETMRWGHGVEHHPSVNVMYVESVASLLVNYQVAMLGLAGMDVKAIAALQGHFVQEEEIWDFSTAQAVVADDFASAKRMRSEEKMLALLKAGLISLNEPLYTTHKLVHRAVVLVGPDEVKWRDGTFGIRECIKAFAQEAFSTGLTSKQAEGWGSFDPLMNFAIERNEDRFRLNELWNQIKPTTESEVTEDEPDVDDEWSALVEENQLEGDEVLCNTKRGMIKEHGKIEYEGGFYYSLADFGEATGGLRKDGYGDFTVLHGGERYYLTMN